MRNFFIPCSVILLVVCSISLVRAQGSIYSFMGGLTYSNQEKTQYQNEPFLRFHAVASVESTSDISPNAMYFRLGYHVKGSSLKFGAYYDNSNVQHPAQTQSIEFHNLSGGVGWKQRRPLGSLWYSYGFGVRVDYNLFTDYSEIFEILKGAENNFTYGVDVNVAMEFPLSEFVSATIEFGVSPDLSQQLFVPPLDSGYNYGGAGGDIFLPETELKNLVYEIRAGFRFWRKVIYTD